MTVYTTSLDHVAMHPAGWVPFTAELEITAAPMVATTHPRLFARRTYRGSADVAAKFGARLLTKDEHDLLWTIGHKLKPILKTPGSDMASLEYALEHDAALYRQLDGSKWDGAKPLANAGKQWVFGAPEHLAWNYGWWDSHAKNGMMWQGPRVGAAHGDSHTDYSQLLTLVRPRESCPTEPPPDTEPNPLPPIKFVQARNYTKGRKGSIDLIVIHDMEARETPLTAENVAAWFAGPNAPKASVHYNVDVDTIVQSVRDEDTAWHAPGANHNGIGIEHAGYARQTESEWLDDYSRRMLRLSARLVATLCRRHSIPVELVDAEGLRNGRRGITTHALVSKAWPHKSNHQDPGKGFPMAWYLDQIRAA